MKFAKLVNRFLAFKPKTCLVCDVMKRIYTQFSTLMPISEDRKGLKLNLGQYLDIAGTFLNIKLLKHIFLNFVFRKMGCKRYFV